MTPYETARALHKLTLPVLAKRKADLKRLIDKGPHEAADHELLTLVLSFTLAEINFWESERDQEAKRN